MDSPVRFSTVVIDLREEIIAYTGIDDEWAWGNDPAVIAYGTPRELAMSALSMIADWAADYHSMSSEYGDPSHRWKFIGDQSRADPWDVYYKEVVHLCSLKILPLLMRDNKTYINCYDFQSNKLVIQLGQSDWPVNRAIIKQPPLEEPPRS